MSPEQVIKKLSAEIATLHDWLINFGDRYNTTTFSEKSQLLMDKISEREELEKILDKNTIAASSENPFASRSIPD